MGNLVMSNCKVGSSVAEYKRLRATALNRKEITAFYLRKLSSIFTHQ